MKTWPVTLALIGAAAIAHADGMPEAAAAEAAAARAQTAKKVPKHPFRPLPRGDLRHCLDLGSNEEIIRCAEKPPKR